jgi:hypothetical protein
LEVSFPHIPEISLLTALLKTKKERFYPKDSGKLNVENKPDLPLIPMVIYLLTDKLKSLIMI